MIKHSFIYANFFYACIRYNIMMDFINGLNNFKKLLIIKLKLSKITEKYKLLQIKQIF